MQPMNEPPDWIPRLLATAHLQGVRPHDFILVVDVTAQRAHLVQQGGCLATHPVSTSRNGLGSVPDSEQTPPGWHRVAGRHGLDEPLGRVFRSREHQAEVISPGTRLASDLILSRILHLQGLEPALNATSFDRFIYIHGTNREDLLGQPASAGCVRMGNRAVIELFNLTLRHELFCWIGEPESL